MKAEEVRDLSDDQLVEKLVALKKEAMNLRFQQASRELENPARMRRVRRDIARVKTAMTARKAAAADKAEA